MKLVYVLRLENLTYNPVPYKRTTQRQKWVDKGYKKYLAFKELLRWQFKAQNKAEPRLSGRYHVSIVATYKDKTHGDTDNIAKGVNDALFSDDKLVSGDYDFRYGKFGGLEVKIYKVE
ncbi:RusA family crossover junction endodeoxyribonuclease [Campylobacter mucosalis]|uniref:Endodeoxyribonuclease, RusA family n=1 Tax=Campylobacter mucosalis CCUG 21559 TaxID=1032067 RepID=A0A6G5QEL5_9BACT|nr:RusA family crossover junction endodeoxyribonuclease [Campylobacter mucosalis]QCD44108.1 endodeoxyribonuclease, RusA family [Campylobacter mucosalis CCUG 21559]QCD44697.1 endodeoxyribonuclease, RusA family [Campylobacter mucosalis CCUG 21559]